jgi:hypothetical protein
MADKIHEYSNTCTVNLLILTLVAATFVYSAVVVCNLWLEYFSRILQEIQKIETNYIAILLLSFYYNSNNVAHGSRDHHSKDKFPCCGTQIIIRPVVIISSTRNNSNASLHHGQLFIRLVEHVVACVRHQIDKEKPVPYVHLPLSADPPSSHVTGCVTKQSVPLLLQESLPELQVSS